LYNNYKLVIKADVLNLQLIQNTLWVFCKNANKMEGAIGFIIFMEP